MNKKKFIGSEGFPDQYWIVNYAEPEEMDNIMNAREHASYLHSIFNLEQVDISSVIDLGFGLGILFEEVLKTFKPYRAYGIEPSSYAFGAFKKKKLDIPQSTKLELKQLDLVSWAMSDQKKEQTYDLGICTSVLQYLSDEELKKVLPVLSQRVRYLYLSVPTDLELKRQIEEVEFYDEYAIHRSKEKYLKFILPHFTIISSRLLESKKHFDEDSTSFTDLLFRF